MHKLLIISLSTFLVFLLTLTGVLFFVFSQTGNDTLRPYVQEKLEMEIGLPVEVQSFKLDTDMLRTTILVNKQLSLEVAAHYTLLGQSYEGIYRMKANHFTYKTQTLRQANISGKFKGIADDINVIGKGTLLDAPGAYSLSIKEGIAQKIEAKFNALALSELLKLAGQPALAQGKVNIDINMPDIGEETAHGYGHIVLNEAEFNDALVQKLYHYTLPKNSTLNAKIDATLQGTAIALKADVDSTLLTLHVNQAIFDTKTQKATAAYSANVKEMRILTQNKLSGPFRMEGTVNVEHKKFTLLGKSHSLGGLLQLDVSEVSKVTFNNLELAKVLAFAKQPDMATGLLNGTIDMQDKHMDVANYEMRVTKGAFNTQRIEKEFGYHLPLQTYFTFHSKGKMADKKLNAKVTLNSTLTDVTFSAFTYNMQSKKLSAEYDIKIPDIAVLTPKKEMQKNKTNKPTPVSLNGVFTFSDKLSIKGTSQGLGKKLHFAYDSKSAKLAAKELSLEKLLILSGLPMYVKGLLDSDVSMTNIDDPEGTFVIKTSQLVTQPKVMKTLLGKPLAMTLYVESKGKFKQGKGFINAHVKTSMGDLKLDKIIYEVKDKIFTSQYILDIPDLIKTFELTDKKLYGPMHLKGEIKQGKVLSSSGTTISLGGEITYTLLGDDLKSKIDNVPLENILAMLGHAKTVQGNAFGTIRYNLKNKSGVVDLNIGSFQIKSSSTTNTVKMFIGKDPARIIYSSTKLHADIKGDVTRYTLIAKGSHSTIEVTEGKLDKASNKHTAKFKFVYEKYVVNGTIGGSIDHPRMMIDPSSVMQSKTGEKIQKKLDKALGEDMGKAVGGFLKGLKF